MTPRPDQPMTVTLATHIPNDDYRARLQDLVQAVIEDVPIVSERLQIAIQKAKDALAKGVQ